LHFIPQAEPNLKKEIVLLFVIDQSIVTVYPHTYLK